MVPTPFLIGIDLGTTNSSVAFVDTRRPNPPAELFAIPQLTSPGVVEPRPALPSFLYFPESDETSRGLVTLPWEAAPEWIAGVLARDTGALVPGRQVSSAKSWLAHPGVDRRATFLPWGGSATGPRVSPVEACTRYLIHLREAWNATVAQTNDALRFERQSIVLTVPASFDEEARELSVEAAHAAQLSRVRLLEEPIAAFYAWMSGHEATLVPADDEVALVCDVGGGTTDFSLIRVRLEAGSPAFDRMAIGDHLLLGGDNLDLALAVIAERKIAELRPTLRLSITQRAALRRLCSRAKERMLQETGPDRVPVTVLGGGRSLVGESVTVELTRDEVQEHLHLFLPRGKADDIGAGRDRRAGLRELGLPYESDPAITRHLAGFLARSAAVFPDGHRAVTLAAGRSMVRPDLLLFNGGFFNPPAARERVHQVLTDWFGTAPRVLTATDLEGAVALGAATYARLRAGLGGAGALVRAGSGRAYYIALHGAHQQRTAAAVCVLARGTEEGTRQTFDHSFSVMTNQPVSFALYSATTRSDRAGEIVTVEPGEDVQEHSAMVTVLRYGKRSRHTELPVRLSVAYTEVGTLEVWCESVTTEHRWRLQFQVRQAAPVDEQPTVPGGSTVEGDAAIVSNAGVVPPGEALIAESATAEAGQLVRSLFDASPIAHRPSPVDQRIAAGVTAETIVAHLEQQLGYAKSAWPLGTIRVLADNLLAVAEGRRLSPQLEARWLNLFGFCLRPGFGAAKDPWRIGEARKVYVAGPVFPSSIQNRVEWLVLWQRASGGFSAGQQRELAQRVMGELGLGTQKPRKPNPQVEREGWRLLANLERLDAGVRVKIGDEVMRRLRRDPGNTSLAWAIGRLGARTPAYGPLTSVVPAPDASRWLEQLIALTRHTPEVAAAIVQVAALSGDPLRDLDAEARDAARQRLLSSTSDPAALRPLHEVVPRSMADTNRAFGEALPHGLRLGSAIASPDHD